MDEVCQLVKIQRDILVASSKYVKDGGVLVYSTCTISKLENEENIEWFTKNFPFELEDIAPYVPEHMKNESLKKGYVQILPDDYNSDGFFIARLRAVEEKSL